MVRHYHGRSRMPEIRPSAAKLPRILRRVSPGSALLLLSLAAAVGRRLTRPRTASLVRQLASGTAAWVALILAQMLWVLIRTPRLPPAPGPTGGTAVVAGGDHTELKQQALPAVRRRSLVRCVSFGDSVAAGVGCPSNELAQAGSLGRALSSALGGMPVEWHAVGRSGATAATMATEELGLLRRVRDLSMRPGGLDVLYISDGVNHLLGSHTAQQFGCELRSLLERLRAIVGPACIILVGGMPPVPRFPAMPTVPFTLSWFLTPFVNELAAEAQAVCDDVSVVSGHSRERTIFVPADFMMTMKVSRDEVLEQGLFSPDGFHPAVGGLDRLWSPQVAAAATKALQDLWYWQDQFPP